MEKQNFPSLKNPPLVEAIVGVKTALSASGSVTPDKLVECLHPHMVGNYPDSALLLRKTLTYDPQGNHPPSLSDKTKAGPEFVSVDGKDIFRCEPEVFSFHRLAPYPGWAAIKAIIQPVWEIFLGCTHPAQIQELNLRYINAFSVPAQEGQVDLSTYLVTTFSHPDLQGITWFGVNAQFPFTGPSVDISGYGQVDTIWRPEDSSLEIILDINVTCQGAFPAKAETLFAKLDKLKEVENNIFFGWMTQKSLSLFQDGETEAP